MTFHKLKVTGVVLIPRMVKFITVLLGITVIASFFISLGCVALLFYYANIKTERFQKMTDGTLRYTMQDSLSDSDDFYQFRQSPKNIDTLGQFYNALSTSPDIKVLSVFDQPLQLQNPQGGPAFYYNTDSFLEENKGVDLMIKSVQMNKTAFDYYNLKLSEGKVLPWDALYQNQGVLPVYLGFSYKDIYDIGALLNGNFYNRKVKFKVIGFLEENSFIYYQNNPEFYIDDYILVPYPSQCWAVSKKDFIFESILYFAMINSDLLASDTDSLLQEIKSISDSTGFSSFSIFGIDDYKIKYLPILSVIKETQSLLVLLFIFLYLLSLFLLYGLERIILYRQFELYRMHWLFGHTGFIPFFMIQTGVMYFVAFLTAVIFQLNSFPTMPFLLIIFQFILLISIYFITVYTLMVRDIRKLISG